MLRKAIVILGSVIIIIGIFFPTRHARYYSYIPTENIVKELVYAKNAVINSNLPNCSYANVMYSRRMMEVEEITERKTFERPLKGGEYIPLDCNPLISTAVIVPYRKRENQLRIFLHYIHPFLQNQKIHYRIFIVDQHDQLPFNRAKMLNYGAKLAIKLKYDCLVLHDVDLIPINTGNIYGCTKIARHMSSSLDTFRFNLPYLNLMGGAVAILASQFERLNGLSNRFYGWGAEDDDFYRRLKSIGYEPARFSPEINRYIMLRHHKEDANPRMHEIWKEVKDLQQSDGLNSLSAKFIVKHEDLYTHIYAS